MGLRASSGAPSTAEAVAVASPASSGQPGGEVQASALASGATRAQSAATATNAQKGTAGGEPTGEQGQSAPVAANIGRGAASGSEAQPQVAAGSGSQPMGRSLAGANIEPGAAAPGVTPGELAASAAGSASKPLTGSAGAEVGRQSTAARVARRGESDTAGGVSAGQTADIAAGAPAIARGADAAPQVGQGLARSSRLGRAALPGLAIDDALAGAPEVELAGEAPGSSSAAAEGAGVATPRASASRQAARLPGGALAKGDRNVEGPGGPEASMAGALEGPQRVGDGADEGPELAAGGGGPLRRAAMPELPSGVDLADDPGPSPAMSRAEIARLAGGPAVAEVTRRQTNSPNVRIAATPGPGGLSDEPMDDIGVPNRLARRDSDEAHTQVERFVLKKSSAPLSIDAEVRELPVEAFRQRDPSRRPEVAQAAAAPVKARRPSRRDWTSWPGIRCPMDAGASRVGPTGAATAHRRASPAWTPIAPARGWHC